VTREDRAWRALWIFVTLLGLLKLAVLVVAGYLLVTRGYY